MRGRGGPWSGAPWQSERGSVMETASWAVADVARVVVAAIAVQVCEAGIFRGRSAIDVVAWFA